MTQERNSSESGAAPITPISSGPFEISPASFQPPPVSSSPVVGHPPPTRDRAPMPLPTMIAVGAGVLVVLVLLTLLLFR